MFKLIILLRFQVIRDQKREEIDRLQHEIAELRAAQVHEIAQRKAEIDKEVQMQREEDDAALEKIQREADQVGSKRNRTDRTKASFRRPCNTFTINR